MSHRFQVEPDVLRAAAREARVAAAAASRGQLREATGLGVRTVDAAAGGVVGCWSSSLDHLRADVSEVASRLEKTADVYEAGDSSGKDAADSVRGGMPQS